MYRRNSHQLVRDALADTPVVLVNGARQVGKSTLVAGIAAQSDAHVVSLDDATVLAAATADPTGWLASLPGSPIVIDEVQKVPDLFSAIKLVVDADRRPGRFLLTGSANVLLLPRISESLAGRMEIITLEPLSQGEIRGRKERFVDTVFADELPRWGGTRRQARTAHEPDLVGTVLTGGFPEVLDRSEQRRRRAWFASYITAILQRDVRDLAHIEGLTDMPRLLSLLAARVGALLNSSELSRSSGIANTTLKRYLTLLEATFLFRPLPAWSVNLSKRLVKSPKIHVIDTGLAAHLAGHGEPGIAREPTSLGPLLEGFVVGELRKQSSWSNARVGLFHYRTLSGREVDLLLENERGSVVGLEIKAAASVSNRDFTGLRVLADDVGERFTRGIVLYRGDKTVAFGDCLHAVPIPALWEWS
jgi:predicted AAA+ superfamily ATPase